MYRKAVEDLTRTVYEAGLEDWVDPITPFLTLCCNGGWDPEAARAKVAGQGQADAPEVPVGEGDVEKPVGEAVQGTQSVITLPDSSRLLDAGQDAERRYA